MCSSSSASETVVGRRRSRVSVLRTVQRGSDGATRRFQGKGSMPRRGGVGVEGPTVQVLLSEPARRPEAPNPDVKPMLCFVPRRTHEATLEAG